MAILDWNYIISRETRAVSRAGFGKILILTTAEDFEFTNYSNDIKEVAEDFDVDSEAYKMASRILGQSPQPNQIAIMGVELGEEDEPTILIEALNDTGDEFYFLTCDNREEDTVTALAEWTETQQKLYGFSTDDLELVGKLEDKGYDRTFSVAHKEPETYPCEGWIGTNAAKDPGSITWNFKGVSGIPLSGFKPLEVKEINGNTYIEQHGLRQMYDGRVSSGEWIDIMRSQDYLYTRIDESIFSTLYRADKVPYDNPGISMIEIAIETPIKRAANNGMIAEEGGEYLYQVSAPRRQDTTVDDRAERILPDLYATVTMAGAIHGGEVNILIQV